MKRYDYKKAQEIIERERANGLKQASLGMAEDWFWTGETIWKEGEYEHDLSNDDLKLGGINCSQWATPSIRLAYESGADRLLACWSDDGKEVDPYTAERGREIVMMSRGCLSGPAQERMPPLEGDE